MSVVLEADGCGAVVVCRASAAIAGTALVLLPVGWHYGHTAAVWRRRRRLSSLRLGRLHALVAGRADGYAVEYPEGGLGGLGVGGVGRVSGRWLLSSAAAAAIAAATTSTQQCSGLSSGLACVD